MAPKSVIPKGYTFMAPSFMVSEEGKKLFEELSKKADNRLPDAFDMYIYNDFYSYGVLDLIDHTLSTLHHKYTKKEFAEAMPVLEALTLLMTGEDSWTGCDDGDRVAATNVSYGALAVAIFRGLKKQNRLNTEEFPSLEYLLRNIAEFGEQMLELLCCDASYHRVCKAIGWNLFHGKEAANLKRHNARVAEWMKSLSKTERKNMEEEDDDDEEESTDLWYKDGEHEDENEKHKDLALSRVWKEYRDMAKQHPFPLRGPPTWDLTEWSKKDKAPFLFSEEGFESEEGF
ncbi:hypothetical protein C8J56DRAFT_933537 [Mycena floridula]|nr:hypothetical protein C8J56DRAFT_933537 [Mycena floridula]